MSGHTFHRDLSEYACRRQQDGPYADDLDMEVIVVGGGFGGTYLLYELRKAGFKTVVYEAGERFGGTWRFNSYPGQLFLYDLPQRCSFY